MEFSELASKAREVRELYEQVETRRYGRTWNTEELALGLVGDIGDLAKLIQAQAGVRDIDQWKTKLAHELSDVLWSIMVLAQKSEINLESEFIRTMETLQRDLSVQLDT